MKVKKKKVKKTTVFTKFQLTCLKEKRFLKKSNEVLNVTQESIRSYANFERKYLNVIVTRLRNVIKRGLVKT